MIRERICEAMLEGSEQQRQSQKFRAWEMGLEQIGGKKGKQITGRRGGRKAEGGGWFRLAGGALVGSQEVVKQADPRDKLWRGRRAGFLQPLGSNLERPVAYQQRLEEPLEVRRLLRGGRAADAAAVDLDGTGRKADDRRRCRRQPPRHSSPISPGGAAPRATSRSRGTYRRALPALPPAPSVAGREGGAPPVWRVSAVGLPSNKYNEYITDIWTETSRAV